MLICNILGTLRVIWNHPLGKPRRVASIIDYFRWQFGGRIAPGPVIFEWIENAKVVFRPGESGLILTICCGLEEFAEMAYILHVANEKDLFVDVGANIGLYAILACAVKKSRGYCFEPIPATYNRLMTNVYLNNPTERLVSLNVGVSNMKGEALFTTGLPNILNRVALSDEEAHYKTAKVPVLPLDECLKNESPSILKIDVEGYETAVLEGATNVLSNPSLHSVILELNGSGERYGYDEGKIVEKLKSFGFMPYCYNPISRILTKLHDKNSDSRNTIFIRDEVLVRQRINMAHRIQVKGVMI